MTISRARLLSETNDERILRESTFFVVNVYEGHWKCVDRWECGSLTEAIVKMKPRSLVYCIAPSGRHAVFGYNYLDRLKEISDEIMES